MVLIHSGGYQDLGRNLPLYIILCGWWITDVVDTFWRDIKT